MRIESPAFEPEGPIPPEHTCDGKDVSPPLAWTDPPASTASFALICDDPDAPAGTWVHWVLWNIPPVERRLAKGIARTAELTGGARQGTNDFRRLGYGGPCPPSGTHRYFFRLFALDATLNLSAGATRKELERAMSGHVLGQAELMGKYRRS
jgi:Raf kinase inhibitor-like YbhB/YbcL family protein